MTRIRVAHVASIDLTHRFLLLGQLRRLRDEGMEVTAISAPGPWVADLEAEGIRHLPWTGITRAWGLGADVRAFRELLRIFRRERFHVVHAHNPKPGIMARLAARMAGVPCVLNTVHGLYATPQDAFLKRLLVMGSEGFAARFSDAELYQSVEDLDWARRLHVAPRSRSELLGNGADLARFDPDRFSPEGIQGLREELGIPPGAIVVGSVGRLVAEKGFREFFEAAILVQRRHPGVCFLVVGGSEPEKADALTEREIGAARAHVLFTGWRDDVDDLMALMDIFVLASWREGVPRSAIEAASLAKAIVATDIRGCREVIRHRQEGLLVPPRDPQRLAAAIGTLVTDPTLRERLGSAARTRALARFDERRVAQTVVDRTFDVLYRRGIGVAPSKRGTLIRRGIGADARDLARLHADGMPGAFLPSLGDAFMRRMYRAMVKDPDAIVVVADLEGRVVGFATGVRSVKSFYRRFALRHGVQAAVVTAPRLIRASTFRRVSETARYPVGTGGLPDAELLSIAVAPAFRRTGVGRRLADEVLRGLARGGVRELKVVVGPDNPTANAFYEDLGFVHRSAIAVHEGAVSNVMVATCPSP